MQKIFLRDKNDCEITPDLVRYFKYQSGGCLIYTFHEIDNDHFMTLYAVKVQEELGVHVAKYTFNDWEWENMHRILQQMFTEIQNHNPSIEDLPINSIQGMRVAEPRRFKMLASFVDTFSGNDTLHPEITNDYGNSRNSISNTRMISNQKIDLMEAIKEKNKKRNFHKKGVGQLDTNIMAPSLPKLKKSVTAISSSKSVYPSSPTAKKVIDSTITVTKYIQLQQENERLKKELHKYQQKYQAIIDLLKEDK